MIQISFKQLLIAFLKRHCKLKNIEFKKDPDVILSELTGMNIRRIQKVFQGEKFFQGTRNAQAAKSETLEKIMEVLGLALMESSVLMLALGKKTIFTNKEHITLLEKLLKTSSKEAKNSEMNFVETPYRPENLGAFFVDWEQDKVLFDTLMKVSLAGQIMDGEIVVKELVPIEGVKRAILEGMASHHKVEAEIICKKFPDEAHYHLGISIQINTLNKILKNNMKHLDESLRTNEDNIKVTSFYLVGDAHGNSSYRYLVYSIKKNCQKVRPKKTSESKTFV